MPTDKCYTKTNKNGGNYTTCVDKKGDQLREKDVKPKKKKLVLKKTAAKTRPKPPPPPGMSQAVADAMIKKANKAREAKAAPKKKKLVLKNPKDFRLPAGHGGGGNPYNPALHGGGPRHEAAQHGLGARARPIQNVSAITAATSASAPKAAPPAANYNMLRPELRKHIIGYIRGEEFSPSKMKKGQLDRMYDMISDDNDFNEVLSDRFREYTDYGGEYREGYFQDKYGDVIESRYMRADEKFTRETKKQFITFLKEGRQANHRAMDRVPGKYDKKTIKELRDVYFDDY